MSRPSVFLSSTYVDLKHVREHVADFIEKLGYLPRLFEKGGVGFDFQKPIDESCYEAVNECDIFVLIIGGRYGAPESSEIRKRMKQYNSITKREYLEARAKKIPIHIFADKDVLSEYKTWLKNKRNPETQYAFVDNTLVFELIDDIYKQSMNNYVHAYVHLQDITQVLKAQWAGMLNSYLKLKAKVIERNTTRINSLKLFYYRTLGGYSLNALSRETGISARQVSSYERLQLGHRREFDGHHARYFPEIEFSDLSRIERALDCSGKLGAGQSDDFLAMYAEYYAQNRSGPPGRKGFQHPILKFETKAVILDFDGTMTTTENGSTSWEIIWKHLGYTINECAMYHSQFRNNQISHQEWCEITLEKFRAKAFTSSMIPDIASKIVPVKGLAEFVLALRAKGIILYIVSGSVRQIINATIAPTILQSFEAIKANDFRFDSSGLISGIVGTKYDFSGKADYLKQVIHENSCSPMDLLFVGNAGNDSWASKSGARTLCVNPTSTDPDNPKHWTYNIRNMTDMREILSYVKGPE